MQKKIMYIALLNYDHSLDGVVKKIKSQIKVFESKGYSVDLYTYFQNKCVLIREGKIISLTKKASRKNLFSEILQKNENYNFLYVRHCGCDLYYLKTLKKYKDSIIVDEIATYPYKNEYISRKLGHIKYMVDYYFWKLCKKYICRIVTYSKDKSIFGIETIPTINGYDFSKTYLKNLNNKTNYIRMVFIANFSRSHGLDRIIMGMQRYYESHKIETIVNLKVIGFSEEYDKYKSYVENSSTLKKYISFEGEKDGENLFEILANSDIGICSLAGFRQNICLSSELKSREYGGFGLPMIGDITIDFIGENSPYYYKVPSNDCAININDIVSFYNNLATQSDFNLKIRKMTLEKCSMDQSLNRVIELFERMAG